ncbi:MAG: ABC transporter ATP-binding protein [Proteobacteria bacterium]|nr:ABC transporter ATP-binding protein [Pseudomonadota bacterium]MBU1389622.1 ABC transporter ATP-binding protein [Pseudomonadota bacterium]MBU1542560.1 ABC transporter ATP-binding protein [Pseudomonadota bacterium]MBU2479483.1 ABC transporter ATP-binding protein [Pseudomonadota bacterium]
MIEVQKLTKYYNDFCAVDGISMTIHKGEILGLLGPNGAGKTTTLRMLTGYFRPTSGTIKIKEMHMPEDAIKIKSLIGYLPESAPLYHSMLVYDYLNYVAKIKGIDDKEKRYDRLLQLSDLCGLSDIMAKPIGNLSKGLKQRVGIAHAMMTDPEILILDEPTSGLDPNQIAEIRDIIKRIGKEKTIIFSTHILSEAEATCDRIAIINNGRVVADDTTAKLTQSVTQGAVIKLTVSGASRDQVFERLSTIDPGLEIKDIAPPEDGVVCFELSTPDNRDLRSQIYLKIKETDWIILQLAKESQALEKIFRNLTREDA